MSDDKMDAIKRELYRSGGLASGIDAALQQARELGREEERKALLDDIRRLDTRILDLLDQVDYWMGLQLAARSSQGKTE